MYGLLIEGIRYMIQENFGPEVLTKVLLQCNLTEKAISTHDQYSETIVPSMLQAVCDITQMTHEQVGVLAGRFFVQFLICHGYGDLMHVMGRRFSDFLKGLDNIHEYFRFSYPKIRPPSFYCSSESEDGLILHYRSRRQGYVSYVVGQLVELARVFYKQELGVKILKRKEKGKNLFVIIQLTFNNTGLGLDMKLKQKVKNLNEYLPVDTFSFLKMFPFFIAFDQKMEIIMTGQGLLNLIPDLKGKQMTDVFDLQKPCIKFTAEGCLSHETCIFQLESLNPVVKRTQEEITLKINGESEGKKELDLAKAVHENAPYVVLRGPIIFLKSCDTFLLLATCVVDGLDDMFKMGLYLNDFGDADCNREIIMASIQKSDHLKNLLESEKQRSQVLTEMTREIAENKRKARQLLAQMMPCEVANTLLKTGKAENCESFDCCSVAFIKLVDFAKESNSIPAVEIVNLLNTVYSLLDEIVDLHGVYKVETISESYMISCGVPYRHEFDTEIMADCCLHMLKTIKETELHYSDQERVQIKIGCFSGPCSAGIVGLRAPRYCLFGDTVNCASRMESHNRVPMTCQIGQRTKDRLERQAPGKFKVRPRGVINVKGKGEMKTYELMGKSGRPRYIKFPPEKREEEESFEREDEDILEEPITHRTSAMSRMSCGDTEEDFEHGSIGKVSLHSDLNDSYAFTIQQTTKELERRESNATSVITFGGSSILGDPEDQNHNDFTDPVGGQCESSDDESHVEVEIATNNKPRTSLTGLSQTTVSQKEVSVAPSVTPPPIRVSPPLIGGINSETPRPTLNEFIMERSVSDVMDKVANAQNQAATEEVLIHSASDKEIQAAPKANGYGAKRESISDIDEEPEGGDTSSHLGESHSDCRSNISSTASSIIEELERNRDNRHSLREKEKAKVQKIVEEQKRQKEPQLKKQQVLPPIGQQSSSFKDKKCRCDELRHDPKLKTKVCSIQ